MSAPLEKLLRDARIDLVISRVEKDFSIINEVINHLDSEIRSIKFNSIHILGLLGERSEKGIPKLIELLGDDDWSICREAVRSLGKIGNSAKNALPKLSDLLSNKEVSIRKEAAIAFGKIGNATDQSISSLIMACNDEDEGVRTEVAKTFGELGPEAHGAIPELMRCLKDVSWTVRTASAKSISKIGKDSTTAIPSLINALEDNDWRVRYRVINTLAEIGEEAVPALLKVINHENPIVRKAAIEALGELKMADPKVIEELGSRLNDKKEGVRGKAADSLRSIGKDSIPTLIKAYNKRMNYRLLDFALPLIMLSLLLIGYILLPQIGYKLLFLSPDLFSTISMFLINGGGIIGFTGLIIDLIIGCVEIFNIISQNFYRFFKSFNKKYKQKILIISAISGIGEDAKDFISFISEQLRNGKKFIRVESARALGEIGMGSEDAIHALGMALNDPKYIVRREAALSLGKLGSDSKNIIPILIKTLEDRNADVRWRASEALGVIGINTEEIISGLNGLIHDDCNYVCESAINALDQISDQPVED